MSALPELFVFILYLMLGTAAVVLLFRVFITKQRSIKIRSLIISSACVLLLVYFKSCDAANYKHNQLSVVGVYYLTNYPGCDTCSVELMENMRYQLKDHDNIIESSDWHYEIGGDYFIIYMNGDRAQLGAGKFSYKKYKLKYPEMGGNQ